MFMNRILPLALYFAIYFLSGFLIPVLSRFLMKFYPCSMHSYFGDILKFYFNKNKIKLKHNKQTHKILKKQYFYHKLLWGTLYLILFGILDYLILNYINESFPLTLFYIFIFLLGFSANIDFRCRLIPDIITFPLLMVAFLISVYCQEQRIFTPLNISTLNSIYSAIGAYCLCFILALMFYFKNPYSFGGGDVKLLTAISAGIGMENLSWILIFSFMFALLFFITKKEKYVALAPLVFMSFIVWIFMKILINI